MQNKVYINNLSNMAFINNLPSKTKVIYHVQFDAKANT